MLAELRTEEKNLHVQLCDCLNQMEEGIRIDDKRVIIAVYKDKNVLCKKADWKERVKRLFSGGSDMSPDEFVQAVLDCKVENKIPQQKLKIVKL